MSDYLGNLLERSFAHPSEVRPQRPSLFEPAPATGLAEAPPDPEAALETEARAAARPADQTPVSRPAGPEPAEPMAPEKRVDMPGSDRTPEPLAPKVVATPATPSAPPILARRIPAPVAGPPVGDAPSRDRSIPTQEEHVAGEKPVVPRADPPPPSPPPVRDTVSPVRTSAAAAWDRPREPAVFPTPSPYPRRASERPIEGVVVRPVLPAREKAAPPLPAPGRREIAPFLADAAPAVPTIQVTIGRVEVRAALPPPPRRTGAKQEPQMSLEAYLHRRTEGGRR